MPSHPELPERLVDALIDILNEAAIEKREAREQKQRTEAAAASPWRRFGKWLDTNGKYLSTLGTIIAAIATAYWTLNTFFHTERLRIEQEAEEAQQRSEERVAQFAMDLADPAKRNTAAYALATQAHDAALDLLVTHLVDATKREDAGPFRSALASAMIAVGEAGLTEAIRLNRDTEAYSEDKATIAMLQSTQQVISHFLRHRSEYGWINRVNFDGTRLVNPGFHSTDLSGVKLRNSVLRSAGLCSTQLRGADLSLTVFSGGILMDADFSDARVDGTRFMHNWEEGSGRLEMHRAKFDRAHAAQIEISDAVLRAASFRDAVLLNAKLSGVDLGRSEMSKADLTGADLMMTDLTEARLVGARLVDAVFYGAMMYKANLSGADLSGTKLFYTFEEKPYEPGGSDAGRASRGAYVLDADFTGASGLSP